MEFGLRTTISATAVTLLMQLGFISDTAAHEPRLVADGALNIAVGWRAEPAYDGVINAMDFIVSDDIEVTDPDLHVKILYLEDDAPDARIIKARKLKGELIRDRSNPRRFNINLMPTKAGAYGFHIKGMVNGMLIDEVFICRGGSQNADGRSFGCIEKLQRFPDGGNRRGDRSDD